MKQSASKVANADVLNRTASIIASAILKVQNRFAKSLHALSQNWGQKEKWVFLYLVCLLFGGLGYISISNAFKMTGRSKLIIIKSITLPKNIYKGDYKTLIIEKELKEVERYKNEHPLLPHQRPSLYDSLSLIEQTYYLQQK